MDDMVTKAGLFYTSVRLKSAASSLDNLMLEKGIDSKDKSHLEWAASLVAAVDTDLKKKSNYPLVDATRIRPHYYRVLAADSSYAASNFTSSLYDLLANQKAQSQYLVKARNFLDRLSDSIFTSISIKNNI